jgi:hypothetical protein
MVPSQVLEGLVVLLLASVPVAILLSCLRSNGQSRPPTERASTRLVIGPAETILVRPSTKEPLIIGPSRKEAMVIGPAEVIAIEPPRRAAWDDRGWAKRTENGQETYTGMYQITDRRSGQRRRFRGTIVVHSGEVLPYIADPPPELRRHPKHSCFQLTEPPWFKVHWHHAARNPDEALLYLEKVLDEAINGRRAA